MKKVLPLHAVRKDVILGSRRFSNYWWASTIFIGALGFLLAGLSSYFQTNLLPFTNLTELIFIPQGIIMTFYGSVGLFLSAFLWLTIIWNIGAGYNEFNKSKGIIKIFRLGFPGKNRQICLKFNIKEIKSIKIDIKEGLNPRREIYLCTKDKRIIPLTRVGQPLLLSEVEEQAAEIARFLDVVLESA
ncbi:photosystem I assembly protein Ycf4 (chloroplast) [Porphyra umbilicalis]|uniref:Photosystem I assembly protein Ycf4 n=1 Tax=Porphyra umbilicalis TaxID=2786 RepID=J7F7H6_PORUM|nr:photosystem I assembly protein Ycf4 [Porphyra umbilicalis]AFC39890.1 photosystem I assembly protein Ycf4 [Porphyra umbilicalis]ASN78694.1 photosystem I assembly protein Ycf4 [Porphyra umbilicalis]|eukprot:ASN78694.1 photosystem I assembly protein Ycf4 (chloroplast) [Porphyra umbilicalis]